MKSKLGIHCGFLACLCFLVGQFFGGVALSILVGYILLKEENEFLRFSALKALVIVLFVSVLNNLIYLLPDFFGLIDSITRIFDADTYFNNIEFISKLNQVLSLCTSIVSFAKEILMLVLALFATKIKTIKLPVIDPVLAKYVIKD
jgi:uncharacterized membrane protein